MPLVSVPPLGPFFVPPLGPSLGSFCLLASYALWPRCLIRSPFPRRLASSSSAGSSVRPLPRIAWLPAPFDKRDGAEQSANNHWRAVIGDVRMVASGWRRLLACLGAMDGAARSSLDRFFPHLIVSSNRRGPGSSPSSHHLISHHLIDGEAFFSFSPDPIPPALLDLLAWGCSPVPGRGMFGRRHGLRRRAGLLLACVLVSRAALSLSLVRSLLYDLCQSCRSFLPRVLWGVLWVILPAILSALAFLNICP